MEECCDLLALPGDRVAFGIVLVIDGDIARGFHDAFEAALETRRAPHRHRAQFVQSCVAVVGFGARSHRVTKVYLAHHRAPHSGPALRPRIVSAPLSIQTSGSTHPAIEAFMSTNAPWAARCRVGRWQ